MKAGPTGVLFGSVTPSDIADEIWRVRKIRIDRRKIELSDALKRIGSFLVPIQIFENVSVEVKTLVVPEGGELPPEQEPTEQQGIEQEPQDATEAETETPSAEPVLEAVLEAEDEGEAAS
jgi:hypothetical protein